MNQNSFTSQSPVSPTFTLKANPAARNNSLSSQVNQQPPSTGVSGATNPSQNPFAGPFFDPSDPALFNFDLSSMNFENRYGALEFGMLNSPARRSLALQLSARALEVNSHSFSATPF